MSLHANTFSYLMPTKDQQELMSAIRHHSHAYADAIERLVPEGADRTYALRKVREVAMWLNVAITRNADGSQRA